MNWISIQDAEHLDQIIANSAQKPQIIFKHSTRCSISSMAKNRLDKLNNLELSEAIDFHYLDLLKFRNLSNKISNDFGVTHQSPQILLIRNGKCIYDESHSGITLEDIETQALSN